MKNSKPVSNDDFVRAWQAASSQGEVAIRTGMSLGQVSNRAFCLRRLGVRLKRLSRSGRPPVDVAALNKIIDGG
jgi:hypothetical protein